MELKTTKVHERKNTCLYIKTIKSNLKILSKDISANSDNSGISDTSDNHDNSDTSDNHDNSGNRDKSVKSVPMWRSMLIT